MGTVKHGRPAVVLLVILSVLALALIPGPGCGAKRTEAPQAPVTLTLAACNSVLLTAADLANGAKGLSGAFTQCATGKSRLTVTGEFAGMRVQNFLRNVTADGTQINTNVNTNDMSTSGL